MSRSVKFVFAFAMAAVVCLGGLYLMGRNSQPLAYASVTTVKAPTKLVAGEPLELDFELEVAGTVKIVALTGTKPLIFTPTLPAGSSTWVAPASVSETAGKLTLLVGERQLDVAIAPSEGAAFTEILVGPHTIVADNQDKTLAVVAPGDVYGNPMPNGTPLQFERLGPTNIRSTKNGKVERSLAWTPLVAGTKAGDNSVWVQLYGTTGVPATVSEVPGLATGFALDLQTSTFAADARTVIELASTEVVDAFGNQLPDGVSGVFTITTSTETTVVPATMQRGRLRAFFTAPNQPAVMRVTATVNGQTSKPTTITAVSAVDAFSVSGVWQADGYEVEVGPVLDRSGALVADGTEVVIDGRTTSTEDGYARRVVQAEQNTIVVSILGRTATHEVRR